MEIGYWSLANHAEKLSCLTMVNSQWSIHTSSGTRRVVTKSLFHLHLDFRQTEQDDIANGLQAFCADLIERIFCRVPVAIVFRAFAVFEINDINCWNAHAQKRHVIVIADSEGAAGKFLLVAEFLRCAPNGTDQPGRGGLFAWDGQILIANHIQQDHRLDARGLFVFLEFFGVVAAAVGVIVAIQTLAPFTAKSLFAIEEDKLIGELSFLLIGGHHARDFQQDARARSAVVGADKGELFEFFGVVMAADNDQAGSLARQLSDHIFEFDLAARRRFGEFIQRWRQAITLQLFDQLFARLFHRC